jgi:hypothetical protein
MQHDRVVSFQVQPADVQRLHEALYRPAWGARHWGRHERLRLVLAGTVLAAFVMLLLKLFTRNKLGVDPVDWGTIAGAALGGAVAGWWWGRQRSAVPAAGSPLYKPQTLSLETSGLRVRGDGFDQHVDWSHVSALREVGGSLLFTTRPAGSHVVPMRAFASPQAAADFLAVANQLRELAIHPAPHEPIETWRYTLTRADVAALHALKGEPRGWRGALLYLLLLPCMGVAAFLVEGADDGTWWAGIGLGLAAALGLQRLVLWLDKRRAIARHPVPAGDIELQRWSDHLRMLADGQTEHLAFETIGQVLTAESHVFVFVARGQALIVPQRAFASAEAMRAFGERIDQASRDSAD